MQTERLSRPVWVYSCAVTLAECVNSWLMATGKKKKLVAEQAGIAPSKLSEIISGANPDPQYSTVEKLAMGFGVGLVEFLSGPRPAKGSEDGGDDRPGRGITVFEQMQLAQLDAEAPADDTIRGDILRAQHALDSAQAALNRALRRPNEEPGAAQNNRTA